ncbi:MAG: hypothetical protein EON60_12320 [Alphaproteobacteria bacterium]|nr:MAG: hypothetical protein EON60_12320 [Alphaproteobacteria bacterium]
MKNFFKFLVTLAFMLSVLMVIYLGPQWYMGRMPSGVLITVDTRLNQVFGPSLWLETRIETLTRQQEPIRKGIAYAKQVDLELFVVAIKAQRDAGEMSASVEVPFPAELIVTTTESTAFWNAFADEIEDRLGFGFRASPSNLFDKDFKTIYVWW